MVGRETFLVACLHVLNTPCLTINKQGARVLQVGLTNAIGTTDANVLAVMTRVLDAVGRKTVEKRRLDKTRITALLSEPSVGVLIASGIPALENPTSPAVVQPSKTRPSHGRGARDYSCRL